MLDLTGTEAFRLSLLLTPGLAVCLGYLLGAGLLYLVGWLHHGLLRPEGILQGLMPLEPARVGSKHDPVQEARDQNS
jgi:hypothetical protein